MKWIRLLVFFVSLPALAQMPQVRIPQVIETTKDRRTDDGCHLWRNDLKASGWTKDERFYSYSSVSVLSDGEVISVPFPSYKQMTGFPEPDPEKLRPRGRDRVIGWDSAGRLVYSIFRSPLPTFTGRDPLHHLVFLEVRADGMTVVQVEHEEGEWSRGDWISKNAEQHATIKERGEKARGE